MVRNNNIETIVIIGDSPAIFAKLYKMKINDFISKRIKIGLNICIYLLECTIFRF